MKNTLLCAMLLIFGAGAAQTGAEISADTIKKKRNTNPVIFADFMIGGADGGSGGLALGPSLNYEWNRNLFTARYTFLIDNDVEIISPIVAVPYFRVQEEINEAALLFGRRYTVNGTAWSFSAGVSANWRKRLEHDGEDNYHYNHTQMVGMPFEASVKFFKRRRAPYRIYGLIPVGPPIAFGKSIGFKIFGNVSKTSFVGVGITLGLGFHKQY